MLLESSSHWVVSLEGIVEHLLDAGGKNRSDVKYRMEISAAECPFCGGFDEHATNCIQFNQKPHKTILVEHYLRDSATLSAQTPIDVAAYKVLEHGFHNTRGEEL